MLVRCERLQERMTAFLRSTFVVWSLARCLEWWHLSSLDIKNFVWTHIPILVLSWSLHCYWSSFFTFLVRTVRWGRLLLNYLEFAIWRLRNLGLSKHGLNLLPLGINGKLRWLWFALLWSTSCSGRCLFLCILGSSCIFCVFFRSSSSFCCRCSFWSTINLFSAFLSFFLGSSFSIFGIILFILESFSIYWFQILIKRRSIGDDQLLTKNVNFLFQFDDQCLHLLRSELYTDHCLIFNFFDSLCELQRLERLLQMAVCSTSCTKQSGLWVTS